MKTLWLIGFMTFIGFGLVGTHTSGVSAAAPAPMISTNEGGCWDKCVTCEQQCRDKSGDDKRACDESCWSTNDSCCSGVGGKGVYKTCGCTDK